METQLTKIDSDGRYPIWKPCLAAGFCLACFAAVMGWIPISLLHGLDIIGAAGVGLVLGNFFGWQGNDVASDNYADIVEYEYSGFVQESKSYDITVRIENGFSIIHEENPTSWRSGIRVKVIDGAMGSLDSPQSRNLPVTG